MALSTRSQQTGRTTPRPFTKPPMSEEKDEQCACRFHPGAMRSSGSIPGRAGGTEPNVRAIRELGRCEWHMQSGYSKRSLVENTMYRYRTIIGPSMRSRSSDGQCMEVQLASKILNTMTQLGMPDSYRLA